MKKLKLSNKITWLFCVLPLSGIISAQTIGDLYKSIPDEMCPSLSKQNRIELMEYYKSGHGDSISNRFGKSAHLLEMDTLQDHIVVASTPISTFEMKILRDNVEKPLVLVIRTACGPICQSSIELYDTSWVKQSVQFKIPKSIDWVRNEALVNTNVDIGWLKRMLEISFVSLKFDQKTNSIIAINNTLAFLSEEDKKLIVPYLDNNPKVIPLEGY